MTSTRMNQKEVNDSIMIGGIRAPIPSHSKKDFCEQSKATTGVRWSGKGVGNPYFGNDSKHRPQKSENYFGTEWSLEASGRKMPFKRG